MGKMPTPCSVQCLTVRQSFHTLSYTSDLVSRILIALPEKTMSDIKLREKVEALERELLEEAINRCNNNQLRAAKLLGISRGSFQYKVRKYNLAQPEQSVEKPETQS